LTIRALIFDFDGLILETEGPSYQSWKSVYRSFGLSLPFSTWSTIIGTSKGPFDPLRELQERVKGEVDWEAVEAKRMASEQALNGAQPILPGVEDYLRDARRLGLKIGLASSSSRNWVMGHLIRLNMDKFFDCVRASDDVQFVKPHPELYLSVLQGLQVEPQEAIALEDSPNGIQSAQHAGIFCVAVPNPLTKRLRLSQADLVLSSLVELPLQLLLDRVNAR
jgi:HAD superfamily hydrolase (TIGR01509 family)